MQSQATTTPQATPAVAPVPATAVEVQVPGATRPITEAEIGVIRRQRSEMSNQLSSARERQEELIDQIRGAPDATQPGLLEHLRVVDQRIVNIESDLERSGQLLRSGQVPVGTTIVPPREFVGADNVERGAAMGALVLLPLVVGFLVLRWKRRGHRRDKFEASSTRQDERMERLEQAVDAIAIEVERVGESQRFQAKMLAEANLMPAIGSKQRAAEQVPRG